MQYYNKVVYKFQINNMQTSDTFIVYYNSCFHNLYEKLFS